MNVKDSSQETFTQEDSGEDSEEDSVSAVEAMYSDDEQQQSDAEDSEEEVNDYEEEVNDCEEENNKEESRNSSDDELLSTIPYWKVAGESRQSMGPAAKCQVHFTLDNNWFDVSCD